MRTAIFDFFESRKESVLLQRSALKGIPAGNTPDGYLVDNSCTNFWKILLLFIHFLKLFVNIEASLAWQNDLQLSVIFGFFCYKKAKFMMLSFRMYAMATYQSLGLWVASRDKLSFLSGIFFSQPDIIYFVSQILLFRQLVVTWTWLVSLSRRNREFGILAFLVPSLIVLLRSWAFDSKPQ